MVQTSLPFLVWGRLSRSPSGANFSPVSFWGGVRDPSKIDCRKKGALILSSLLEDLVVLR